MTSTLHPLSFDPTFIKDAQCSETWKNNFWFFFNFSYENSSEIDQFFFAQDPEKLAAMQAAAASAGPAAPAGDAAAAPAAAKVESEEEESDDDMGFGLFD